MFFGQRNKLKDITTVDVNYDDLPTVLRKQFVGDSGRGGRGGHAGSTRRKPSASVKGEPDNGQLIFMQEHLTSYSKKLLKDAKDTFNDLGFQYPGYIKDGEVRVKFGAEDKPHTIRSKGDIANVASQYAKGPSDNT